MLSVLERNEIVSEILLNVRDLIDVQHIELPPVTEFTLSYKGITLGKIRSRPSGGISAGLHHALANNFTPNELENRLAELFNAIGAAIMVQCTATERLRAGKPPHDSDDLTQWDRAWQIVKETKEYLAQPAANSVGNMTIPPLNERKAIRQTAKNESTEKLRQFLEQLKPGDEIPTLKALCVELGVNSKNTVKSYLREIGIPSWEEYRRELISKQHRGQ